MPILFGLVFLGGLMAYYDAKGGRRKKWKAVVNFNGIRHYLGYWLTKEEAEAHEQRFRDELLYDW
jgi:hypothetical protein